MATFTKRGDYQWQAKVRRRHITESKTFESRRDAEAWARQIESEIDRGIFQSRAESESTTMTKACERYEREVLPKLKGKAADKSRLKTIAAQLGRLPLAAINSTVLAKFRDDRLKVVGEQSVIHEIGLITRILKACVIDWGIALPAGVPKVRKPSLPAGRNRRISDDEVDAICKATESQELAAILRLALETAMRRSEIAGLRWQDVDYEVPCIGLKDTKNGEARDVPMSTRAVAILKAVPSRIEKGELVKEVFSLRADSITQAFDRAVNRARKTHADDMKKAGKTQDQIDADKMLVDLHFHDLRHEATSRIAEKVSNLVELATITGHKDLQMLKRYYHPRAGDLARKLG